MDIIIFYALLTSVSLQVELSSSLDVRLIVDDETDHNNGRVEILSNNQWRSICEDDYWDHLDATVVCRELNLGLFGWNVSNTAIDSPASRQRWSQVKCTGAETSIRSCGKKDGGSGGAMCAEDKSARVSCTSDVRFSGGSHSREGQLVVLHDEEWVTVTEDELLKNPDVLDNICLHIGLGSEGVLMPKVENVEQTVSEETEDIGSGSSAEYSDNQLTTLPTPDEFAADMDKVPVMSCSGD